MTGEGAPDLHVESAAGLKVVVIASQWHEQVMSGLLDGARRALTEAKVEAVELRVPGVFELPVAASRVVGRGDVDVIIALGVVIRGGTPHFDYVCSAATTGLTLVAQRTGIPIGFGVLTCDDEKQALDRAGLPGSAEDKGYEAAMAGLATAVTLREYECTLARRAEKA